MNDKKLEKSLPKILLTIAIGLFLIFVLSRIFAPNYAAVSGSIQYNGIKPEDPSQGEVVIQQRLIGESNYESAVENVALKDGASWIWDEALEGETYQLQAYVIYQGEKIGESSTIVVTAPAVNQTLVFNITTEDLPESAVENTNVTISGSLNLNGYVPDGSTVSALGKEKEENDSAYVILGSGPAADGRKLSWNAAKAGTYYTFIGQMYDPSGILIGESEELTTVAPSTNQVITIESTLQAPAQIVSISGVIKLNGPIQPNSTVLLLQRKPGESNYTAFDRIPAVNDAKWSWNDAESGREYEISASLQVDEEDSSVGNVLKVTAPASDEVITINTNYSLNSPNQTPTASCGNQQDGKWNASVVFPSIENAAQYYLQVGTSQGSNDLLGERTSAVGGSITRNVLVNDGASNYATYAYTFDSSCSQQQCFSGWSPTLIFKCPQ